MNSTPEYTETDCDPSETPRRKTKGRADSMDEHVGARLRMQRALAGISQEKLAESAGVTFQQIQKYERGTNRISASRLYQFSKILSVPVAFFFEEFAASGRTPLRGFSDQNQALFEGEDVMSRKETLDLLRVYYAIPDPKIRKDILKLIKNISASSNP